MSGTIGSLTCPIPLLQHAEFVPGSLRLRVPAGEASVFSLPETSPDLARAYLQAVQRVKQSATTVDVTVVLDGGAAAFYGPPACWEFGTAQRVLNGELRLGILRLRRAGSRPAVARAPPSPVSAPAPSDAAQPVAQESSTEETTEPPRPRTSNAKAEGPLAKVLKKPLKVGISSDQGGCEHMEDATLKHHPLGGDFAFCGVFDGHGGDQAAKFCAKNLHLHVMAQPSFYSGDQRAALRDGFRKTEADLMYEQSNSRRGGDSVHGGDGGRTGCCGTTALLMLLCAEQLHVAWLGDCRAVLCRAGSAFALTVDHSLKDAAERQRAIADGGRVEGGRLGGYLEVARALGDFDHTQGCKPRGLSAQPSLRSEAVRADDEFVILASDGLWGVVTSEDAVRIARAELAAYDGDAGMASEKLVEVALKRHADDNVSVMVVALNTAAAAAQAERPRERPRLVLTKRSIPPPGADAAGGAAAAGARESASSIASSSLGAGGAERTSLERSSVTSLDSLCSDLNLS